MKKQKTIEELMAMELHEVYCPSDDLEIIRVPGGWIYKTYSIFRQYSDDCKDYDDIKSSASSVFVSDNNFNFLEGLERKYKERKK